jgi:ankyrin repeat protein
VTRCRVAPRVRERFIDAARDGDLEKVKALLKDNPELVSTKDNDGWTALHFAASNDHKNLVELLLANQADVNAKAKDGWTPLRLATLRVHEDVAESLRQHSGHE